MYQEMYDPSMAAMNAPQKFRRSSSRLKGKGRRKNAYNNYQVDSRHDPQHYHDYRQMDDDYDHDGYGGYNQNHYESSDDDYYDDYADAVTVRASHSSSSRRGTTLNDPSPTSILKSGSRSSWSASKAQDSNSPNLCTSDPAFQMTAKLVVDYLGPKMETNASSYFLDDADVMFLEAVVPEEIRQPFVEAVSFRVGSIASGNSSPLEFLVKECQRLGLGRDDCFFLGGGIKMDDGRILIEVHQKEELTKTVSGYSDCENSATDRDTNKNSEVSDVDFKTADQAFHMTAKLVTDYLSPKLPHGTSSYHIDDADTIYLDAVVPNEIRPNFVEAIAFRATSLSEDQNQLTEIEQLVKECIRLGLGKEDCFLLGGGMKMADGRILVLPGGNGLGKKKKQKKKKKKPTESKVNERVNHVVPSADMSWLANSGLPPDQMHLIMSAMSNQQKDQPQNPQGDTGQMKKSQPETSERKKEDLEEAESVEEEESPERKTAEEIDPQDQNESIIEEKPKIPMDSGRRKRTSKGQASLPPISTDGKKQLRSKAAPKTKRIGRKANDNNNGLVRSSSTIGIKQSFSSASLAQKDVIGGIKRTDSSARSERALNRRMRSIERRSRIGLYVEDATNNEESPLKSNWRDDLWDFTAHGIFHKFLLLSFIAPLFALGQVQTRSKLTWLGVPAESTRDAESVFFKISSFVTLHILSNAALITDIYWDWTQGVVNSIAMFFLVMVNSIYFIFLVVACGNTRWSIRRSNNIPQLFELADYLMSLFYLPLVIAQLGRHTVDYSVYNAQIFSATGLPADVKIPSGTKYVQPQINPDEESGVMA